LIRHFTPTAMVISCAASIAGGLHAQHPPSQRELNGFLLGQHEEVLANQFGQPVQQQDFPDGWAYRAYVIDSTHHAYMVFKFSDFRSDYIYSIQIAGDSGTSMYPFVDLRLGDSRAKVTQILGEPSRIEEVPDMGLDALFFENRNYSVELSADGKLFSIQIMGYDGFPDSLPLLQSPPLLGQQLRARDIDRLVEVMAPDMAILVADSITRFSNSARVDLADPTSAVSRLLYSTPGSLGNLLADSAIVGGSDLALRVYEHPLPETSYMVWSFGDDSPLQEIVYQGFAGQWRIWEIRFR
jgi:hypothetical protein